MQRWQFSWVSSWGTLPAVGEALLCALVLRVPVDISDTLVEGEERGPIRWNSASEFGVYYYAPLSGSGYSETSFTQMRTRRCSRVSACMISSLQQMSHIITASRSGGGQSR